jgi:hypothetical protein
MQLLATSDDIVLDRVYPFENRYLVYFLHLVGPMAEQHDPTRHLTLPELLRRPAGRFGPLPFDADLDRRALQLAVLRGAWQGFSDVRRSEQPTARYYAEKASGDYSLLDAAGLEPRFVQLLRDPRDIFTSILAFDAKRGFFGFGRRDGQSEEEYLEWWLGKVVENSTVLARRRESRAVFVVRYEDLVTDLRATASQLGEWLDVDLTPDRVQEHREAFAHHMTTDDPLDSVGRWRRELPDALRRRIEEELPGEVAFYGP